MLLSFVTDKNVGLEEINNYGKEFKSIAIIPSCVDDDFWRTLGWKERTQIWRKKGEADIRLRMDYERFISEDYTNKKIMFVEIIIKSIKIIQLKSKGDFNGEKLIKDIRDGNSDVEQIFILTHNVFFHKETAFIDL